MRTLMRLLAFGNRLAAVFRGRRLARDLDEEMAFHLEQRVRDGMAGGLSEAEARTAARRSFGSLALAAEDSRAAWRWALIDSVLQDLRYAARVLRRSPVFTLTVAATLALGIGANTAIFTLIDRVFLRSLPVDRPERLVALGEKADMGTRQSDGAPDRATNLFSVPLYRDMARLTDVFSDVAAAGSFPVTVYLGSGAPAPGQRLDHASALPVSGNLFRTLGVSMALGRPLTPADDAAGARDAVAVLGHGLWTRRYNQDPGMVGQTIRANGTDYRVVGVAGRGFRGLSLGVDTDLWVPLAMQPRLMRDESFLDDRNMMWLRIIGRLADGMSVEQAAVRTNDLFRRIVADEAGAAITPDTQAAIARLSTELVPFGRGFSHLRGRWGRPLALLAAVAGLVLLIACANIGNLLLARAASRQREISLRLALGAGRRRLGRQLLTESLVLSVLGGAAGLLVAHWTIGLLMGLLLRRGTAAFEVALDGRILLFATGATALAALLFGLAPALRAAAAPAAAALRTSSGAGGEGHHGWRLRRALVVFQVAVSLCLLVGAGLLLRSLNNLRNQDLGFRPESVVIAEVDPQGGGLDARQLPMLHRSLLERLEALPEVSAASMSLYGLLSRSRRMETASIDGDPARPEEEARVQAIFVTPRYFEAIGATMAAGRVFTDLDGDGAPMVAVVSAAFVRHFFGDRPAIGRRFGLDGDASSRQIEIVGIVGDIKPDDLRDPAPRLVYRPAAQVPGYLNSIEVRTTGDPARLAGQIRRVIAEVAPALPALDVVPLVTQVDSALHDDRMLSRLTMLFGLVALTLAAIGLHGVLAYSVAARTGEIGIRLALGADGRQVRWMVLRQALGWVAIGAGLGLVAALILSRSMASLLFGIDPVDPATLAGASATLAITAAAASYWPAHRAARLHPLSALRCD